jgi:arylsulfatase A-like enzyme
VPLIVRWPGKISSETTSNQPTVNVDFYPTLLEAAKVNPNKAQKLDGVSILANWTNSKATPKRDAIYWHYPLEKPHFLGGISGGAIRAGDWKLIESFDTGKVELYNLAKDVGEKNNLAEKQPKLAERLQSQLVAWRKTVGATKEPPRR